MMSAQFKQQFVSAAVVVITLATIFFVLFHRSDMSISSPRSTDTRQEVVYDLPLAGQAVHVTEEEGGLSMEDTFATTSAELQVKAAQTTQVTAHILRTKPFVNQKEMELDESVASAPVSNDVPNVPEAWIVELEAFEDADHAVAVAKQLRSIGWLAYARETTVFVGPYIDRHKADMFQDQLQKNMHRHGVVKKFTV